MLPSNMAVGGLALGDLEKEARQLARWDVAAADFRRIASHSAVAAAVAAEGTSTG